MENQCPKCKKEKCLDLIENGNCTTPRQSDSYELFCHGHPDRQASEAMLKVLTANCEPELTEAEAEMMKRFDEKWPGRTLGTYQDHAPMNEHGIDGNGDPDCSGSCPKEYFHVDDIKPFLLQACREAEKRGRVEGAERIYSTVIDSLDDKTEEIAKRFYNSEYGYLEDYRAEAAKIIWTIRDLAKAELDRIREESKT